ncbi:hypothetical protein GCM10029963_71910 [Micromonospora andamanensis]
MGTPPSSPAAQAAIGATNVSAAAVAAIRTRGRRRPPTGSFRSLMTLPSFLANTREGLRAPAHGETVRAFDLRLRTPAFVAGTLPDLPSRETCPGRDGLNTEPCGPRHVMAGAPDHRGRQEPPTMARGLRRRMSVPAGMIGG